MDYEHLFWTESNIESITVHGRDLEVIASHVFFPRDAKPKKVQVFFLDVERTERVVTEYIGDPRNPAGFKEPYVVHDLDAINPTGSAREFGIEGITTFQPIAWLDWTIEAVRYEIYAL